MAAEMKVTDEVASVLEASFSKLQYTESLRDALRLAMEDALSAMLLRIGYEEVNTKPDDPNVDLDISLWHWLSNEPIPADTDTIKRVPVYRIKETS